jgi:hypothetical protein
LLLPELELPEEELLLLLDFELVLELPLLDPPPKTSRKNPPALFPLPR